MDCSIPFFQATVTHKNIAHMEKFFEYVYAKDCQTFESVRLHLAAPAMVPTVENTQYPQAVSDSAGVVGTSLLGPFFRKLSLKYLELLQ